MSDFLDRVASAPISWGICEVPGWGEMLPTRRVLGEMSELGFAQTELGAPGFLPEDPAQLKDLLAEFALSLSGAFTPLETHDLARRESTLAQARSVAKLLADAGATRFITSAIMDQEWSHPRPLSTEEHRVMLDTLDRIDDICEEHGLLQVLHPHVQTLVETADDVNRILDGCGVNWCLDTGHLAIGGVDPVEFAKQASERVGHVHLKDVRMDLVPEVLRRETSLMSATQSGLFTQLGQGDVDIRGVVQALEAAGYRGSYVIEQDTAVLGSIPSEGEGPVNEVRSSLNYLSEVVAPTLVSAPSAAS